MHEKSKIRLEEILAEHERLRAQAAVQLEEDARRTATFMDRFERMKDSITKMLSISRSSQAKQKRMRLACQSMSCQRRASSSPRRSPLIAAVR